MSRWTINKQYTVRLREAAERQDASVGKCLDKCARKHRNSTWTWKLNSLLIDSLQLVCCAKGENKCTVLAARTGIIYHWCSHVTQVSNWGFGFVEEATSQPRVMQNIILPPPCFTLGMVFTVWWTAFSPNEPETLTQVIFSSHQGELNEVHWAYVIKLHKISHNIKVIGEFMVIPNSIMNPMELLKTTRKKIRFWYKNIPNNKKVLLIFKLLLNNIAEWDYA